MKGQEFVPENKKRFSRINVDLLSRKSKKCRALRKVYEDVLVAEEMPKQVHEMLSSSEGGTAEERAENVARLIDKIVMTVGKKICGIKTTHPKYTKPGYTKECARLRKQRSLLSLHCKKQRNRLRHKTTHKLADAQWNSLQKSVRKCQTKMNQKDPTAI